SLCIESTPVLEHSGQISKAVLARLMWSRLDLAEGKFSAARTHADLALRKLASLRLPILNFHAHYLFGCISLREGNASEAFASFEKARLELEGLRATVHMDELKITFIKDKDEVYESLVDLCVQKVHPLATPEKMFEYIELAKSRSLMELMRSNVHPE